MTLDALIFDVDGTLALTEEAHRQSFNEIFAEQGLDVHWDRATYGRLLQVAGGRERLTHWFRQTDPARLERGGPDWITEMHRRKTERFQALLAAGDLPLRPGIARLLAEARAAGLATAIATTTHRGNLDALLDGTLGPGAMAQFAAICTAGDVAHKKPAPDLYLCALDRLGLAGNRCLAIEDSGLGLQSARSAGIPVLITTNDYFAGDDFRQALAVLDGLGEPDAPARVLAGPGTGAPVVADLAWLEKLTCHAAHDP